MESWELAKYLLDAKKVVDSVWYISDRVPAISNINIYDKVHSLLRDFYVNCCLVLDNALPNMKKKICSSDDIIRRVYYERDKKYAHKDDNYSPVPFSTITELKERLIIQINRVFDVCAKQLPESFSLDFVPHDRELFRFVHGVTTEIEENIKRFKHPEYGKPIPQKEQLFTKTVLYDIDDIKGLSAKERNDYCVIIESGLNCYEGLQNRQDGCIKLNLLYGQQMWARPNEDVFNMIGKLQQLGFLDQFEILNASKFNDPDNIRLFEEILKIGK